MRLNRTKVAKLVERLALQVAAADAEPHGGKGEALEVKPVKGR